MIIHGRASRTQVRQLIRALPGMIAGDLPAPDSLVEGLKIRIANAALQHIKIAYSDRADGRADETGLTWPPLTRKYLAYQRRFGPTEKADLKRAAGLGAQHRYGVGGNKGLLTKAEQKAWNAKFASLLAYLRIKGLPEEQAKNIAAGAAWNAIKAAGANTMLQVYGSRKVQILRDTGVLFNSLSPGLADAKPKAEGSVMRTERGAVVFGTNVPYGAHHHYAKNPKRRRPLWPDPQNWPSRWWKSILTEATRGVEVIIRESLR